MQRAAPSTRKRHAQRSWRTSGLKIRRHVPPARSPARRPAAPPARPASPTKIEFSFLNDILMVTARYPPISGLCGDAGRGGRCSMEKDLRFFAPVHRTAAGCAIGVRKSDMDRRDAKRLAAAALLVIPLGGCVADQKKTFAACQYPIAREFGKEQALLAGEVQTCMKVNGFKLQTSKYCPDDTVSEITLLCYQPKTWLGQIG